MTIITPEIEKLSTWLPLKLVAALSWKPINEGRLGEALARMTTVFPPVYLPVFESEGDIVAIHVRPFVDLSASSWFHLPHDAAEPELIATAFKYLPRCVLRHPSCWESRLAEVWGLAQEMAASAGTASLPALGEYVGAGTDPFHHFKVLLDPTDAAARAANTLQPGMGVEASREAAERLLADAPDDPHAIAAAAQSRAVDDPAAGAALALRVFSHEVTHGYPFSLGRFVKGLTSSAEVFEAMRTLIAASIDEDVPLAPLREQPLTGRKGAAAMRTVAHNLRSASDHRGALTFLRNGAAVAGVAGAGLSKDLCEELAEQAERVEPGGLSARLARFAAEVFDQGP